MCPNEKGLVIGAHSALGFHYNSLIINLYNKIPMSSRTKKNTWTLILKVIITVATAVAGALGRNACI